MLNEFELTGRARTHVTQYETPRFAAHPDTGEAFLRMRAAAAEAGFDLAPFSTFRDYQTQLGIWNKKFAGDKPLYDDQGRVRDRAGFTDEDIVRCILNWSALPGASRHHWGSEIDVVDRRKVTKFFRELMYFYDIVHCSSCPFAPFFV